MWPKFIKKKEGTSTRDRHLMFAAALFAIVLAVEAVYRTQNIGYDLDILHKQSE